MSFSTRYITIFERLQSKLQEIADFAEVNLGWKERVDAIPSAYVIPTRILTTPVSPIRTAFDIAFEIHIVCQQATVLEGLKQVMDLLGDVRDKLVEDRTLGDNVQNLEIVSMTPYQREGEFMRYWGVVEIVCSLVC